MENNIYKTLAERIQQGTASCMVTIIKENTPNEIIVTDKYIIGEKASAFSHLPVVEKKEDTLCFYEPVGREDRLIILGGGHISKALCTFAAKAGFMPWVIDERREFANKERFPDAAQVICGPFMEVMKQLDINGHDYVTIVTRGHSSDGDCLLYMLNHEMPGYLGMIGSRKRVRAQFDLFRSQGVMEEKLQAVHTPIGLDIKAVTPEEIAVSILAELILVKRTDMRASTIQTDLERKIINEIAGCQVPAAAATIVRASGSTPRREGAKMLVFKDGRISGSIGGGLGENEVIKRAVSLIGTGKAQLFRFVLDADVAKREGMACGGDMDILIEDLSLDPEENKGVYIK